MTLALAWAASSPLEAQRAYEPPNKEAHRQRRAKFLEAMEGGIAIIVAAHKDQERIYEFFVDHSDLHDFIYLTGLEGIDAWESALVLAPDAETYREILYTSQDPDRIRSKTGIEHVYPYPLFMEHLSDGITDYSLLRTHQRGSKALATDLSLSLGEAKNVYFNYQRFLNLAATPPERLDIANPAALLLAGGTGEGCIGHPEPIAHDPRRGRDRVPAKGIEYHGPGIYGVGQGGPPGHDHPADCRHRELHLRVRARGTLLPDQRIDHWCGCPGEAREGLAHRDPAAARALACQRRPDDQLRHRGRVRSLHRGLWALRTGERQVHRRATTHRRDRDSHPEADNRRSEARKDIHPEPDAEGPADDRSRTGGL